MKKNFFSYLTIIFFFLIKNLSAESNIAYINLDYIMNESLAGKSIISQLNNKQKILSEKFINDEKILKEEEIQLISQKNILKKEEFANKVVILKKKIKNFNSENLLLKKELNNKKNKAQSVLVETLTKIIGEFAQKNSIAIVFPKSNIFLGKTELDITNEIIKTLNLELKEIKIK